MRFYSDMAGEFVSDMDSDIIIKINNLHFSYTDESGQLPTEETLKGVDFSAKRGEFLAVLGHNGSGKSTLARHLNAILTPTEGSVEVCGVDTSDEDRIFELRQHIGMVFQNPDNQIVSSVVEEDVAFALENMGVPYEEMRSRTDEALKSVGMYEYRLHSPSQLSGGQKQRIAIAGIIAMRPDCIVLDEPTAMLDPQGRKEVMQVLKRLNRDFGITVILITHYMDEAVQCGRVAVMEKGRIILDGTPEQIFSEPEKLIKTGLGLPQATELAWELKKAGYDIKFPILSEKECADEIERIIKLYL